MDGYGGWPGCRRRDCRAGDRVARRGADARVGRKGLREHQRRPPPPGPGVHRRRRLRGLRRRVLGAAAGAAVRGGGAGGGALFRGPYAGDGAGLRRGAGVRVAGNFALGVAVSYAAGEGEAAVSARAPHPIFDNRDREFSGPAAGLRRQELGVHVQALYLVPVTDSFTVTLFGGPTMISLQQDLVADVEFRQEYPFETAAYERAIARVTARSRWDCSRRSGSMVASGGSWRRALAGGGAGTCAGGVRRRGRRARPFATAPPLRKRTTEIVRRAASIGSTTSPRFSRPSTRPTRCAKSRAPPIRRTSSSRADASSRSST